MHLVAASVLHPPFYCLPLCGEGFFLFYSQRPFMRVADSISSPVA